MHGGHRTRTAAIVLVFLGMVLGSFSIARAARVRAAPLLSLFDDGQPHIQGIATMASVSTINNLKTPIDGLFSVEPRAF
jgi:hypothetical protein